MAIQHSSIADPNIHEPKGIATATLGQQYVSDGAGSGNWLNVSGNSVVLVSSKSDLPTPSAGVITLVAGTEYRFLTDVSLGTDRLVLGDKTVLKGIDSLNVTLTYTGTGDMMTMSDADNRIAYMTISCTSGRVFNWTCTATKILRVHDVTVLSCNKFGIFNGVDGILRFTNVSLSSVTTDGLEFLGTFRSLLWEVSAYTIAAGAAFNLGTAVFDSFIADTILITLNGSSNLVSGAASSANISATGIGLINTMRINGTGTPLSTISVDDARWEFRHNDDIADTRPDGLLSMQGNATATVITVAGTYVLTAGTWTVQRNSQMTGTTAGRITYNGGKSSVLPITASLTVEPVSGTAVDISVQFAKNGTLIPGSKRTTNASAGNPASVTAPWQLSLDTSDYVEVYLTNDTNTVNILASSAVLRVN